MGRIKMRKARPVIFISPTSTSKHTIALAVFQLAKLNANEAKPAHFEFWPDSLFGRGDDGAATLTLTSLL
jgi:hypothetical protein